MRFSRMTAVQFGAFILLLAITACGAATETGGLAPQANATTEVSARCDPQYVSSAEAGQHLGEETTVCGLVKDYFFSNTGDKPTLLLFDHTGSGRIQFAGTKNPELSVPFAVFVLHKDKSNFPNNFGSFYSGKTICATGVIERLPQGFGRFREDNPVIVARSSSRLDVDCKAQPANR